MTKEEKEQVVKMLKEKNEEYKKVSQEYFFKFEEYFPELEYFGKDDVITAMKKCIEKGKPYKTSYKKGQGY